MFPIIDVSTKLKDAWDALHKGYQCNAKVLTTKLQSLLIKEGNSMHDYFSNM
jgi:hypothetical protein